MSAHPAWQWNEMQHVGTDFSNLAEVERYDARMGAFRDVDAENAAILAELGLPPRAAVLEIGCGTGRFALAAARAGHRVDAIDVSPMMLAYAARRAEEEGLAIRFAHAGFLGMAFPDRTFDAVVSVIALHHLPDVWKLRALENVHAALQPGGVFYLRDVVFPGNAFPACCRDFIGSVPEEMRPHAEGHVAREFSTFDWIMDGLFERAGFVIRERRIEGGSFGVYHAVRPAGEN